MTCVYCGNATATICSACAPLITDDGTLHDALVVTEAALTWRLAAQAFGKELGIQGHPDWWAESNPLTGLMETVEAGRTAFDRHLTQWVEAHGHP